MRLVLVFGLLSGCYRGSFQQRGLREEILDVREVNHLRHRKGESSFISPLSPRCLLIPSKTGCTTWKEENCRSRPQKKIDMYDADCFAHNGRIVKDCKVVSELVPSRSSLTICSSRMDKSCFGPCYNCENFCRPQMERTCWRNQQLKKSFNTESVDGKDMYTEKESLESVQSCSEQKVGEICAPVNCRFNVGEEECTTKNETEILTLKTRTCETCVQRLSEVKLEQSQDCEYKLQQDCRSELSLAWTKLCSDKKRDEQFDDQDDNNKTPESPQGSQSETVEIPRQSTSQTFGESSSVPRNKFETSNAELQSLNRDLNAQLLNPVNSLILKTLSNINVDNLKRDTVVVISTPRSTTSELVSNSEEEIKSLLVNLEATEREEIEVLKEVSEQPMNINVNVKYEFGDTASLPETNARAGPSSPRSRPRSLDFPSEGLPDHVPLNSASRIPLTKNIAKVSTDSQSETSTKHEIQHGGSRNSEVYFDQSLQILNDQQRIDLAVTAQRTTPTTVKPIIFGQNPFALPSFTTNIPVPTTTVPPPPTYATATTTTRTIPTTTTRRYKSSAELLKLCFTQNSGCDFQQNEIASPRTVSITSVATTTTTNPTTTTTSRTASTTTAELKQTLSPKEKINLCFTKNICSEGDITEYFERRQREIAILRRTNEYSTTSAPPIPPTTSSRPAAALSSTDRRKSELMKAIQARASACFWRQEC